MSPPPQLSRLWEHFEQLSNKTAVCKLCRQEYSYKTSITNLRKHLSHKHISEYRKFLKANDTVKFSEPSSIVEHELRASFATNIPADIFTMSPQPKRGRLWEHFDQLSNKIAMCKMCKQNYSYRTSITNLKKHLRLKHINEYRNFSNMSTSVDVSEQSSIQDIHFPKPELPDHPVAYQPLASINIPADNIFTKSSQPQISRLWEHFDKLSNMTAACKICTKNYSYKTSITNLKKHLYHAHISAYQSVINANNSVTVGDPLSIAEPHSVTFLLSTSRNIPSDNRSPLRPIKRQRNMSSYILDKKTIDTELIKMFTLDYQPFAIVEDTGFKSFVQSLNPNYQLPNRKTITSILVPEQYSECKNKMLELVHTHARAVCITIDCWTSSKMDSYLSVTAHFLKDFEMISVLLHCETFTRESLYDTLMMIEAEWQIKEKVTLAVSANEHDIVNAVVKIGWPFFGCFLNKLNLLIEKAFDTIEVIVDEVTKIAANFNKSLITTEAILKFQTDFEKKNQLLKQSAPTRWNSVYHMLERFLLLQDELEAVTSNPDANLPTPTKEMWAELRQICAILKPFDQVTKIMCGTQYFTASLAIVIVDGLKNVLQLMEEKSLHAAAEGFLKQLESGLGVYFSKIEDDLLLGICTFLDPRFKIHAFLDNNSDVAIHSETFAGDETNYERTIRADSIKKHILELIMSKMRIRKEEPTPFFIEIRSSSSSQSVSIDINTESISIWGKIDRNIKAVTPAGDDVALKANRELHMYLNEDIADRESCPLAWWKSHACVYPNLSEIFSENCHTVVTSVQCERLFSKAGRTISDRRTRLSTKHISELVFLNCNYNNTI